LNLNFLFKAQWTMCGYDDDDKLLFHLNMPP
jgi:hypothetical protein